MLKRVELEKRWQSGWNATVKKGLVGATRVKICGLMRAEDVDAVNAAQPDYAGFVFYEKSSRAVDDMLAAQLRARLDPKIPAVGVFVHPNVSRLCRLLTMGVIQIVQLHHHENRTQLERLRTRTRYAEIWQAYYPAEAGELERAAESPADRILFDSGFGSGQVFDRSVLADFPRPYILAGGVRCEDVGVLIEKYRPFALDVSSSVESNGWKDADKIMNFVAEVRAASGANRGVPGTDVRFGKETI